jgi:4-hydroxybenzoate polyprenyltransferase
MTDPEDAPHAAPNTPPDQTLMTGTGLVAAEARPQDAEAGISLSQLPPWLQACLRLSRYDRPVGFWLLFLPCALGLMLARFETGLVWADFGWLFAFGVGAVAMRGAGCTWNDILDRDIDAKVARTALRPFPAGQIRLRGALVWLMVQLLVGLVVLLSLTPAAQTMALWSIPLVAAYPLMKRITWWPQVWLGLTFNWGALVAMVLVTGGISLAGLVLYAGLVLWTLGYDTIYALQDREDDALIGVRSTARRFGARVREAVGLIYLGSAVLLALAVLLAGGGAIAFVGLAGFAAALVWQTLAMKDESRALYLFRINREIGLGLLIAWALAAALGGWAGPG